MSPEYMALCGKLLQEIINHPKKHHGELVSRSDLIVFLEEECGPVDESMMPSYEIGVRICLGWLMSHNIIKLQSVDFSTQGYRPLYIQGYKVV